MKTELQRLRSFDFADTEDIEEYLQPARGITVGLLMSGFIWVAAIAAALLWWSR